MGNPAVWWFGLVALLYVTFRVCWQRRAPRRSVMVVVAFASQFLPWVIVPRSTFIYHYFASVPFIILASALLLDDIRKRNAKRRGRSFEDCGLRFGNPGGHLCFTSGALVGHDGAGF
jgi:dolichyl-phosphate-mannose--protein O-mannosyl transferase